MAKSEFAIHAKPPSDTQRCGGDCNVYPKDQWVIFYRRLIKMEDLKKQVDAQPTSRIYVDIRKRIRKRSWYSSLIDGLLPITSPTRRVPPFFGTSSGEATLSDWTLFTIAVSFKSFRLGRSIVAPRSPAAFFMGGFPTIGIFHCSPCRQQEGVPTPHFEPRSPVNPVSPLCGVRERAWNPATPMTQSETVPLGVHQR